MERIRTAFAALGPCYQNGRQRQQRKDVELLTDLDDVRRMIDELTDSCRTEALHVQPGGARDPEALLKARGSVGRLLSRGVSSRSIYQHPARYGQHTVEFAEWMMERGAEVRTPGGRPGPHAGLRPKGGGGQRPGQLALTLAPAAPAEAVRRAARLRLS
ncbi:hypothetical protein GTW69_18325 [Streptomyces sp. SID7760]|nr:hypothetical protein [Streptomyces sp. SID7760]